MTNPIEVEFQSAGARLVGYKWLPGEPETLPGVVVMVHGLTNHHEDAPMFSLLRDECVSNGLGVFMFDFFGSGKSDGLFRDKTWSVMRENLADVLDLVSRDAPESLCIVSRSVGASVAGFFAKDTRVTCSVLSSPVLRLVEQFQPYWSPLVGGFVQMPGEVERSGQIKGAWELNQQFFDELEVTEKELVEAVKGAQRVLVTHGHSDPKVRTSNSTELMDLLAEPKRYVGVEAGDHYYTGHESEAVSVAVDWVIHYTAAAARQPTTI